MNVCVCLKEMETDIADLDAVLAELEGIQTGDLTTCE